MYAKLSTAVWHAKRDPWSKAKGGFYVTQSPDGYDYDYQGQGKIEDNQIVVASWGWMYTYWHAREVSPAWVQRMVIEHPELKRVPDDEIIYHVQQGYAWQDTEDDVQGGWVR